MIELPAKPRPNSMDAALLDFGFTQRGAASLRVDRPGARHRAMFGFQPMRPDEARAFLARFKRGKRQGVRVYIPLLVDQGSPGSPVVDGAGQAGSSIAVRGLTPAYIAREDFWLTIVEADGKAYLHSMAETAVAAADGTATFEIEPPLRAPFADGDTIHIGKPYMEGFIDGSELPWRIPPNQFIELTLTVEEYR